MFMRQVGRVVTQLLRDLLIMLLIMFAVLTGSVTWVTMVPPAEYLEKEEVIEAPAPATVPHLDMELGTLDLNPLVFAYGRNPILRI